MGFVTKAIGKVFGGAADAMTTKNQFQSQVPEEVLQQQRDLSAALLAQSQGQGPNPAQEQFQNNLSQVGAQQAGAIASQKGISPALQARMIANQGQQSQMQGAGAAAALQAQQQLDAQRQLAGNLAQMSGQSLQSQGLNADVAKQNAESTNKTSQGLMNAAGSGLMMLSDEREKTNISSGEDKIQGFLDAISAKQYNYKDSANGAGKHVSPMAQDLEKTPVGDSMVMDTPQGKVVDYGKGFGAILAAQAHLNDRLNSIEGKYAGGPVGMKQGGKVPGRAKVEGDSPKNDTVVAKLSPGEIVIPRSLAEDPERAKRFIQELKSKKKPGYGKVLEAKRKK